MGIPGLFSWLRKNCPYLIRNLSSNKSMTAEVKHNIENLCLDMNGIFHEACQKVYKYGNKHDATKPHTFPPANVMRKRVFEEVGNIVNNLVYRVRPSHRVLIMVDGPAGNAKQSQQRQRRYRSVQQQNSTERKFDSNCISPGTEWMDFLSKFMDQFIRRQITNNPIWKSLNVIFSNEKVAGEGEYKLIRFIRNHGTAEESYVLYGLDADLIMLTLLTQNMLSKGSFELEPPKFYILREDQYSQFPTLLIVDISLLRQFLIEELTWGIDCSRNNLINDYIFLCFLLGNDFLPHSPTVDLIEGGLELLFDSYSEACAKNDSHLIEKDGNFNCTVLKDILYQISIKERSILEHTIKKGDKFADPLLQKYYEPFEETKNVLLDFDGYRKEYYTSKFPNNTVEQVCHEYFRGMEWVFKYYTSGIPSWSWSYPFFYAPFAKEMMESLDTYVSKPFQLGRPMEPFRQLLSILPPQSKELIPQKLWSIIEKFPKDIKVDLAGKKFEWQGIVLVPPLTDFDKEYREILQTMEISEKRRNFLGKEYLYKYRSNMSYEYKTYYGTFECSTEVTSFD